MLKRKHDKIINIMQLRFFCQVALRGSVSRAADDLFRTQSAITRAIRDLEAASTYHLANEYSLISRTIGDAQVLARMLFD